MIFFLLLGTLLSLPGITDSQVKGHYRKDGTYVKPHYRSDPNPSVRDNWSTKGNVNPYTGKPGTRNPSSINKRNYLR